MNELQDALDTAAHVANTIGDIVPGPTGVVARIAGLALSAGAAMAESGANPEIEIRRILSADPFVSDVHSDWNERIREKFRSKTDVPAAPDTLPDTRPNGTPARSDIAVRYEDIYEDVPDEEE